MPTPPTPIKDRRPLVRTPQLHRLEQQLRIVARRTRLPRRRPRLRRQIFLVSIVIIFFFVVVVIIIIVAVFIITATIVVLVRISRFRPRLCLCTSRRPVPDAPLLPERRRERARLARRRDCCRPVVCFQPLIRAKK